MPKHKKALLAVAVGLFLIIIVALIAVITVVVLNASKDCLSGASGVGGPGWQYNITQKNPSSVTPEKVAEFAHKNQIPGLVAVNASNWNGMTTDTAKTFIDQTTAAGINTPAFLAITAQEGASLHPNNWINHFGYGFGSVAEGVKADASYMHDMAMKPDDQVRSLYGDGDSGMHVDIHSIKDLPPIGSFGRYGILATGADKSNYFNKGPYTESHGYHIQDNFNRWVGFFTGGIVNGAAGGDGNVSAGTDGCSTGGGAVKFAEDGTGDEGSVSNGQRWTINTLPGQLRNVVPKQFLDGEFISWWQQRKQTPADWGNCTDLTFAAMAYIWGGDKYTYAYTFPGNGNGVNIAPNLRSQKGFSGKVGAGSAGSSPMHTLAGHTWVIIHVFKDTSVLAMEQNVPGYSGTANGQTHSYNFVFMKNAGMYSNYPANYACPPDNWKKVIGA